MAETDVGLNTVAGTSDLMNPAPPETPEAATARMEALKEDPDFQKRVVARDPVAFAEHTRLWRIAHGMTPEPVAPVNTVDVMRETVGRELADVQMRAESLRADGISELEIYEILNDCPLTFTQRQGHERELARLQKDRAFIEKYMAGDPDARHRMRRVHAALSMQVGTEEQADAWQRAHSGRKPT